MELSIHVLENYMGDGLIFPFHYTFFLKKIKMTGILLSFILTYYIDFMQQGTYIHCCFT